MKKLILIAFIVLFASACTKQYKAQVLIKDYLKHSLNDPDSYQSVDFGRLLKLKNHSYLFDGKIMEANYKGGYTISHTYRAKNEMGGLITKTDWFKIDSSFRKADCCYIDPDSASIY